MKRVRYGLWAAVAIVVLVLGTVVAWKAGWWLERAKVDEQVKVDNRNKGTQTAWRDEAEGLVLDYEMLDGPAGQSARRQACELIGRLVGDYKTPTLEDFEKEHCS